jgi:hypothetical protein
MAKFIAGIEEEDDDEYAYDDEEDVHCVPHVDLLAQSSPSALLSPYYSRAPSKLSTGVCVRVCVCVCVCVCVSVCEPDFMPLSEFESRLLMLEES